MEELLTTKDRLTSQVSDKEKQVYEKVNEIARLRDEVLRLQKETHLLMEANGINWRFLISELFCLLNPFEICRTLLWSFASIGTSSTSMFQGDLNVELTQTRTERAELDTERQSWQHEFQRVSQQLATYNEKKSKLSLSF